MHVQVEEERLRQGRPEGGDGEVAEAGGGRGGVSGGVAGEAAAHGDAMSSSGLGVCTGVPQHRRGRFVFAAVARVLHQPSPITACAEKLKLGCGGVLAGLRHKTASGVAQLQA